MNAGIDAISFYTSRYYLDLKTLGHARGVDPAKYTKGLGQEKMGVVPPDEDIVTLGASAAKPLMDRTRMEDIELLLFATESGIDQSKAAGLFVHGLLGLSPRCRVVELKEACYAGTAALRLAASLMARTPGKKALVIASDIARYELGSPGEPTQGCGAVAMLVCANPAILALDEEAGFHAEDVMDFWRPNYRDEALVDGKYSTRVYLQTAVNCWTQYGERSGRKPEDFARFCYHLPFTQMARKAHAQILRASGGPTDAETVARGIQEGLGYNRVTGNTYSASLYEGLASLLDGCEADLAGHRLGFFSYGSGSMGEFFSGVVQPGYQQHLLTQHHRKLLESRTELSFQAYEDIFNLKVPTDGWDYVFAQYCTGPYRFGGVGGHKRRYEEVS